MAMLFIEGFDKYGPAGLRNYSFSNLIAGENYSGNTVGIAITSGLSGVGYAASIPTSSNLVRGLPSNYSRLICGIRFQAIGGTNGCDVMFEDGTTAQCTVQITSAGALVVRTGNQSGTIIDTASISAIALNTTHYLEMDITFGNPGSYTVWLDGAQVLNGSGATRSSANNYANGINLIGGVFDDWYCFDSTGTVNNAVCLDSPIVETQFPTADAQKQWEQAEVVFGQPTSAVNNSAALTANNILLCAFTPAVNMTLTSIGCMPITTTTTAKTKAVIYTGIAAGATLIATGSENTGVTANTGLVSTFSPGVALTAGTTYGIGFITDTLLTLQDYDSNSIGVKATNTYTSGAPATLPTMTTGTGSWLLWGSGTTTTGNWRAVANVTPLDDISYVQTSTVGNEDLYSFSALSSVPTTVHAVAVKGRMRKSDSGTFNAELHLSTGATDSAGSLSATNLGSSYQWYGSNFDTDPGTGAAWTNTGLNAATAGPKIAS